jgi:hypothetical protein
VAVVHTSALVVTRASTHPRGETLLGRKGCYGRADLSGWRRYGIQVLAEQTGHLLVQFGRSARRSIAIPPTLGLREMTETTWDDGIVMGKPIWAAKTRVG